MELESYKVSGDGLSALTASEGSKVSVNPALFTVSANASVIHSVVRWQRAARRAGTHATLNRKKMEGGGKKPWKQKGTGRARAGSSNSPLWVGGAVIFGPQPRSYAFKLPRKVKLQALLAVLSDRAASGSLLVVDQLPSGTEAGSVKTTAFSKMLESIKLADGSNLATKGRISKGRLMLVYSNDEASSYYAARNIEGVECIKVDGVNTYDLLRCKKILISEPTLRKLEESLKLRAGDKA
jgi:large subunit ribosomal protein L4